MKLFIKKNVNRGRDDCEEKRIEKKAVTQRQE